MSTCDIIIPTYNGKKKLPFVLDALLSQEIPEGWNVRIILSDDGSQDFSKEVLGGYLWNSPWISPLILNNNHRGRSYARNVAIDHATADILLFLADDIILRPYALASHLRFHTAHSEESFAALGCVQWDPRVSPTPFMDWMMHGGQQNDYDSLLGVSTCSPTHYFYGSFLSMKRLFLGSERFSEAFSAYGWEDLELGERLGHQGLTLHVLHDARSVHRHFYSAYQILMRQRTVGTARFKVNTNTARKMVHFFYNALGGRMIILYFMKVWGNTINLPRLFALGTAGEFWYGVHHANTVLKSQKE